MVTGAYVRFQRDGKWQNIEVDELSDEEWDVFEDSPDQQGRGWNWARFLGRWIRDNVTAPDA